MLLNAAIAVTLFPLCDYSTHSTAVGIRASVSHALACTSVLYLILQHGNVGRPEAVCARCPLT